MATAPSLHGRYPLPRYYGPLRLPAAAAADTVMSSRTAADARAVALLRVSQVPRPFCPRALSPFIPAGPAVAASRCFTTGGRLQLIRRDWPPTTSNNETESGSLIATAHGFASRGLAHRIAAAHARLAIC